MVKHPRVFGFLTALALTAAARGNVLINGGLESTLPITEPDDLIYASPTHNANALAGWTITSGTIDIVPKSYWQADQGTFSVDMVGTPGIGSIQQSFATIGGDLYSLTFDFSINPQKSTNEENTTKILQIQALDTVIMSDVLASQDYQGTAGTRTVKNMEWETQTFQFVASGTESTLTLAALTPLNLPGNETSATCYCGPVIDNLDLENLGAGQPPTPEPASLGILGLGAVLLMGRRKRRTGF